MPHKGCTMLHVPNNTVVLWEPQWKPSQLTTDVNQLSFWSQGNTWEYICSTCSRMQDRALISGRNSYLIPTPYSWVFPVTPSPLPSFLTVLMSVQACFSFPAKGMLERNDMKRPRFLPPSAYLPLKTNHNWIKCGMGRELDKKEACVENGPNLARGYEETKSWKKILSVQPHERGKQATAQDFTCSSKSHSASLPDQVT